MLFNVGNFTLASGQHSNFKIDCDHLTDEDLYALAEQAFWNIPLFKEVYGVPTGGLRFAEQMKKFIAKDAKTILIVDDVFTTGKSITKFVSDNYLNLHMNNLQGLVIFARNKPFYWINSIFSLDIKNI